MDIIKEIEHEQSSVVKYAIYLINELSYSMKSNIDPMIFAIYNALFPKTLDINEFIANDAEKTIVNVSRFCSGNKVADTLLIISKLKYMQYKYSIAKCLGALYETHFYSLYKDYKKF